MIRNTCLIGYNVSGDQTGHSYGAFNNNRICNFYKQVAPTALIFMTQMVSANRPSLLCSSL